MTPVPKRRSSLPGPTAKRSNYERPAVIVNDGPVAPEKALAEIWNAEDRDHARRAVAAFKLAHGAKFAKAAAKITDDLDELPAFYDYPIESTFATVRHRTKVTKGPESKAAGIAMAFKLIEATQARRRAVNAPHLVTLIRASAKFKKASSSNEPVPPLIFQTQAAQSRFHIHRS